MTTPLPFRPLRWVLPVLFGLLAGFALVSCSSAPREDRQGADLSVPVEPFATEVELASPDETLRIEVGLDEFARPRYRVIRTIDGQPTTVVGDSTLGYEAADFSFSDGLRIDDVSDVGTTIDTFDLPTGKARSASITANERSITFGSDTVADLTTTIDLWASDHAVAYRYRIDDSSGERQSLRIDIERTSFAFPAGTATFLQPHDAPTLFAPAYEAAYETIGTVDEPRDAPYGWTFPALFRVGENWALVTESALTSGQSGSRLGATVTNGEYIIGLPDPAEGNTVSDPGSTGELPYTSPWRIIITSPDLGKVAESNVVRHLSPSSDPAIDYSWVQPGRVSWSWWSDHESSRQPDELRRFIDLAADIGWEYSLIDANWDSFGDEALLGLIDHADERGVGLMLWYNSGGPNNAVTEAPRDRMADREVRRAEMARIAELGIVGIKVDFFHSDKPPTIEQYRDILADAADHELLVNFHGATVPRGWSREFPNLMTVEAVRGAEIYTFDLGYQTIAPRQNTQLPFTRNVVGSMDYTPVIVGDTVSRRTTNGHELALAVVFESSLQHFVDTPEDYFAQPDEVVELLGSVPSVWDEMQLLDGFPGTHAAIARRNGDTWWIGAINGIAESTNVSLNLADLDGVAPGDDATVVCDAAILATDQELTDPTPAQLLDITDKLPASLELQPFGGCLIRVS